MNAKINPILMDLSMQLPDSIQTLKYIQKFKSYKEIAAQARKEIFCLANLGGFMRDGGNTRSILHQSGYEKRLESCEDEDRLRLIGTL